MSKKILIDSEKFKKRLEKVKTTITYTLDSEFDADRLLNADSVIEDLLCDIDEALEDDEPKRYSVLEWHPVSEKPKDASDIVVKYNDGFLCSGVAHADENGNWVCYEYGKNQMKEWAYLPEREEEL
jgi:hypothetical protein